LARHGALEVLPFLALCLSGTASTTLLVWLWRLRKRHWRKLMARQLFHLCSSDLFFCFFAILSKVGDQVFILRGVPESVGANILCSGLAFPYSVGLLTSVLVEAHMAISFAAAMHRWNRVLWFLGRSLVFLWPLGAALAGLEVFLTEISLVNGFGCRRTKEDFLGFTLLLMCFLVCLVCYVCSATKASSQAGEAIRRRVWNRANWYLVVALVSFGPNSYRLVTTTANIAGNIYFDMIALTLFNFSGLFNAIVYALQSSYVRRTRAEERRRQPNKAASQQGGGSQDSAIAQEVSSSSTPQSTPRIGHQGSFHVAFQEERTVFEVRSREDEVRSDMESSVSSASIPVASQNVNVHGVGAPVEQAHPVGSVESDSEWLLGCFEASPLARTLFDVQCEGSDEDFLNGSNGLPSNIFTVGAPPLPQHGILS